MVNPGDDQSSSEPVSLLGELQHMLMVSHSPSKTGDRSSTNSPELPQEDEHRSHASGDNLCDENDVADMDEDNQEEEQQPWAMETESVVDHEPGPSQDPMSNITGDPVAYTLIRDLDDRVQNNEDQLKKQGTFNDSTHQSMTTMSHKIRALEAKVDRLQEMINDLCKSQSMPAVERKAVRSKRSTQ